MPYGDKRICWQVHIAAAQEEGHKTPAYKHAQHQQHHHHQLRRAEEASWRTTDAVHGNGDGLVRLAGDGAQ